MSEKEDTYHDTILDLEAKLKKNVDLILKLGNSLQGMFMLGPKPLFVYDQQLKHGWGYPNPYTLKQAISKCPKLYVASSLDFVPQKELSVEQKYFPSSSIPSVKILVSKNMPNQLLEASLKHDIELGVLLNHECVDKSLHDELEQVKKKSLEIQEGLKARIKILKKDVQRCEKQSVDFELKLKHEKEKHKWDSLKNKNSKPLDFS
ncbi:hypothetical protein Tco_0020362 [Tanacetum coccineum]